MVAHIEGLLILLWQRLLPGLPIKPHVGHPARQTCEEAATKLRVCLRCLHARSSSLLP